MDIRFTGSSDDIVEISCSKLSDELDAYDKPRWIKIVDRGGNGIVVCAQYAPNGSPDGTWMFGVTLLAEDKPIPNWHVSYGTASNGYSPELTIEAPDDVEISF